MSGKENQEDKNPFITEEIRENEEFVCMVRVLFVCHGSISKSPGKAGKINGFTMQKGAYYTTTTPFTKVP